MAQFWMMIAFLDLPLEPCQFITISIAHVRMLTKRFISVAVHRVTRAVQAAPPVNRLQDRLKSDRSSTTISNTFARIATDLAKSAASSVVVLLGELQVFSHAGNPNKVTSISLDQFLCILNSSAVILESKLDCLNLVLNQVDIGFDALDVGSMAADHTFTLSSERFLLSNEGVDLLNLFLEVVVLPAIGLAVELPSGFRRDEPKLLVAGCARTYKRPGVTAGAPNKLGLFWVWAEFCAVLPNMAPVFEELLLATEGGLRRLSSSRGSTKEAGRRIAVVEK
ncbi:hypothetical protein KCU87_g351, partial [Aureobasidium melanogenum]